MGYPGSEYRVRYDAPGGRDGPPIGDGASRARRLREGDTRAFDGFIREHWAPVVFFLKQRVGQLEHAQDLAQESFARLWERRSTIDPSRSVVTYLYRIARNLAIDELRKLEVRRRWEEEARLASTHDAAADGAAGPLRLMHERKALDTLAGLIEGLPERRREAFVLVHVQGLSYREAAEVMGNAPQTVANQATTALAELRLALRPLLSDFR
jgi:RNA polymerase sigma factor (sigma-70 family)